MPDMSTFEVAFIVRFPPAVISILPVAFRLISDLLSIATPFSEKMALLLFSSSIMPFF